MFSKVREVSRQKAMEENVLFYSPYEVDILPVREWGRSFGPVEVKFLNEAGYTEVIVGENEVYASKDSKVFDVLA